MLNIRSFGVFTLYPFLQESLTYASKKGVKQGTLMIKKAVMGAAVAEGVGITGVLVFGSTDLPEQDFHEIQLKSPDWGDSRSVQTTDTEKESEKNICQCRFR